MKNQIGDVSKSLTIIRILNGGGTGKHKKYVCFCSKCNKESTVLSSNFKLGKGCFCQKHLYNDLTGDIRGKLKILFIKKRACDRKTSNRSTGHLYECECLKCKRIYEISSVVLNRINFKGCRCPEDHTLASKKFWYSVYKRNALNRNIEFNLCFDEFVNIVEKPCYYTGIINSININKSDLFGTWKCNGIDRLDSSKGYILDNVVSCCSQVNLMKGTLSETDFLELINKIYKHQNNG